MKNPIDPRQYTPYAMDTDSGNLEFVEGVDFWKCYLLENLTGNFNITGSLKINDSDIYHYDSSNDVGGTRPQILAGIDNFITGTDNALIGTSNSLISGNNNTLVGGRQNQVADANYGVGIGSYVLLKHTGAMVLGDSSFLTKESMGVDSLSINFTGGMHVNHEAYFNSDVHITGGNLYVSGNDIVVNGNINITGSGNWSGDINILGIPYHTGSPIVNHQHLLDESGTLRNLTLTGSGWITSELQHLENTVVFKSGTQIVSGEKTFLNELYIGSGWALAGTGSNNRIVMDTYTDAFGWFASGRFKNSFNTVINHGGGAIAAPSGENLFREKSFSIDNNSHDLIFGVNTSGDMYIKGGITMTGDRCPTAHNSPGVSGMMCWDKTYQYICTGWYDGVDYHHNSGWSRIAFGNWN